jgi:two-component system nitrogen regulation response regulator NtrX
MNVLIADDEKNIRTTLAETFRLEGFDVETAEDGEQAVAAVERGGVDLLLLDLQMPRLDGLATLRRVRELGHATPTIFLTAHGTIERAVEAVRLGAFDFIEKPPHSEKILISARNALRQAELEEENAELRGEYEARYDMIGGSAPMQRLFQQIQRTAPTQARVLILGENGTGKELIARALHRHSPRKSKPFVRVNCAAIPRELFESELFGHERGAFTGATSRRRGKFVRADGGTLFLDEVGEMPAELQAKLLRTLESGELEPVGADREVRVDVRVLAATNRDLERAATEGAFRRDLYYRLQVVTLEAPPLRERREDIPALVGHFLAASCADNNLSLKTISEDALRALIAYDYPGNVRELRNLIERMVILTPAQRIDALAVRDALPRARPREADGIPEAATLRETLANVERQVLIRALERHGWKMTTVAASLGLERSHLYKKLKSHGIERP